MLREHHRLQLHPPVEQRWFSEPPTIDLLWRLIEKHSEVKEFGIRRFSGSQQERQALWTALRGSVIQAQEYFRAAEATGGLSAALLYYYCFMNLAKAEILLWKPDSIFEPGTGALLDISHGFTYRPNQSRDFEHDFIKVKRRGVFPLLYEKRLGCQLSMSTLDVLTLLLRVPELATDLDDIGLPSTRSGYIDHVIGVEQISDTKFLHHSICAFRFHRGVIDMATSRFLQEKLKPVTVDLRDARRLFGFVGGNAMVAKYAESGDHPEHTVPGIFVSDADRVAEVRYAELRGVVDIDIHRGELAILTPSIDDHDFVPLPASLASYALMYYISGIVRYKPYRLYSEENGRERWLFDAYIQQAPVRLLMAALNGISGQHNLFSQG
jgi:hypothetical protein